MDRNRKKPVAAAAVQRPPITRSLTASEFASWYWLKAELVILCRLSGLGTSGAKLELQAKIMSHLSGGPAEAKPIRRRTGKMPEAFSPGTIIGHGWRCNPSLGAFFRQVCGSGFHFNAAMREYIHNGAGKSLADAAIRYQSSVGPNVAKGPIPKQLEYNRHFREFFAANPGAKRQEAIDSWWQKRGKRRRGGRAAEEGSDSASET